MLNSLEIVPSQQKTNTAFECFTMKASLVLNNSFNTKKTFVSSLVVLFGYEYLLRPTGGKKLSNISAQYKLHFQFLQ